MSNQLHELLAVEKDLATKATNILNETITTFVKKTDHFDGLRKDYTSFSENSNDLIPPETKEVVTTVEEKLDFTNNILIKSIDATISKEESNASGEVNSELKIGNVVFGEFSSISLLVLEKKLTAIRAMYKNIPTLDPTRSWEKDNKEGRLLNYTKPEVKYRTVKKEMPLVLSEATEHHPAQVNIRSYDEQAGKYETVYKSGRVTPLEKSEMLNRVDELIIAVKKARAKANQANVKNISIGKKLLDYITNKK